ncbi:Prpf4, partial [Symbiodinium necroappetens]
LSDYCYGLRSNEASGSLAPPWTLVLSCEAVIRKLAYKRMATKGLGFADALVQAWKDAATTERQFTTLLSLCAKTGCPAPPDNKGTGKGGKGQKGDGGNKKLKTGKAKQGYSRTAEGEPICYRYNAKNGCKKEAKCHFKHVCTKCLGDHPVTKCTQRASADAAAERATHVQSYLKRLAPAFKMDIHVTLVDKLRGLEKIQRRAATCSLVLMVLEQPEDLGAARGAASRVETGYDVAMAGPSVLGTLGFSKGDVKKIIAVLELLGQRN